MVEATALGMLYTIQTALTSSIQFCKNISILFFENPQNLKQFREIESPAGLSMDGDDGRSLGPHRLLKSLGINNFGPTKRLFLIIFCSKYRTDIY